MEKNRNVKNLNFIADFVFEMGTLRNMRRMHAQVIFSSNDTIASHSFRTAIIAYLLADLEGVDKNKALKMALFHDIPEARTGDANFINKFYSKQKEKLAYQNQTKNIPGEEEIKYLLNELSERKTKEAIIAKDADILDQISLQKEVLGEKPEDFLLWHNHAAKKLKTKSAKLLAESIKNRNPMQWFYNLDEELKKD
jgi:putative hydrolases of HD superfamily